MAADQRYCLNCGHRRGEPRLPFMDAVVFMESMSTPGGPAGTPPPPPPAEPKSNRMNANAALIAGVATLVLAIGVGFLIGRTGHENSGNAQAEAPIKVIEVGTGGGGGEAVTPAVTPEESNGSEIANEGNKGKSSGKAPSKKKASEVKEGSKEEEERAEEKTAQVLHSKGPQAKTGAQVGDKCEPGTPGCEGEEFTGNFFGE
jgi:type IV secretory pathway VirB10-like protein